MPARVGGRRPLKDLADSIKRLDTAVLGMGRVEVLADRAKIETHVASQIKGMVRAALMRSLNSSGLKRDTGALADAVNTADIWIMKGKIRCAFKAGIPPKEKEGREKPQNVYIYGSAQNFGAVYTGNKHLGDKAKRTLKRAFLTGRAMTKREKRGFEKGVIQVHDGKVVKRDPFDVTSASVRRPHRFFFIGQADRLAIQKRVDAEIEKLMRAILAGTGRKT